jgi:CRISPR/Cas system CMR-associated protein Cmr3 (group 5 of RAMP superfamily)
LPVAENVPYQDFKDMLIEKEIREREK